jgi:hypothetical protein
MNHTKNTNPSNALDNVFNAGILPKAINKIFRTGMILSNHKNDQMEAKVGRKTGDVRYIYI